MKGIDWDRNNQFCTRFLFVRAFLRLYRLLTAQTFLSKTKNYKLVGVIKYKIAQLIIFFSINLASDLKIHRYSTIYRIMPVDMIFHFTNRSWGNIHNWLLVLVGGKEFTYNAGNLGLILGSRRSPREGMTSHSSILPWRILRRVEPGGLQSMGSQRVGHSWVTNTIKLYYIIKLAWFMVKSWSTAPARLIEVTEWIQMFTTRVYMY